MINFTLTRHAIRRFEERFPGFDLLEVLARAKRMTLRQLSDRYGKTFVPNVDIVDRGTFLQKYFLEETTKCIFVVLEKTGGVHDVITCYKATYSGNMNKVCGKIKGKPKYNRRERHDDDE